MGSACSANPNNALAVVEPTNEYDSAINAELAPFLALESPYNINHKYAHFFKVIRAEFVGSGIKKTHGYKSKLPLEEVYKKRVEFWETRVEGEPSAWKALREASEAPEVDAVRALGRAKLKLVNSSLQLAFDNHGNKYDVPIFCLNDPSVYDLPKKKEVNREALTGKAINVKFRMLGMTTDIVMQILDNCTVRQMKEDYVIKLNDPNVGAHSLRFFFGGKELDEKALIAEYNIQEDLVVQIFKRK